MLLCLWVSPISAKQIISYKKLTLIKSVVNMKSVRMRRYSLPLLTALVYLTTIKSEIVSRDGYVILKCSGTSSDEDWTYCNFHKVSSPRGFKNEHNCMQYRGVRGTCERDWASFVADSDECAIRIESSNTPRADHLGTWKCYTTSADRTTVVTIKYFKLTPEQFGSEADEDGTSLTTVNIEGNHVPFLGSMLDA